MPFDPSSATLVEEPRFDPSSAVLVEDEPGVSSFNPNEAQLIEEVVPVNVPVVVGTKTPQTDQVVAKTLSIANFLPQSAAQMDAADVKLAREVGSQPLVQLPHIPADPNDNQRVRFEKAAGNTLRDFVSGATTAEGIAGIFLPPYGIAQMIAAAPEAWEEVKRSEETPPGSQERWDAGVKMVSLIGTVGFGAKAMKEGISRAPKTEEATLSSPTMENALQEAYRPQEGAIEGGLGAETQTPRGVVPGETGNVFAWEKREGTPQQAPLSYSGDYVISERTGNFTLSYRPEGEHLALGSFRTLEEAKAAAGQHALPVPEIVETPVESGLEPVGVEASIAKIKKDLAPDDRFAQYREPPTAETPVTEGAPPPVETGKAPGVSKIGQSIEAKAVEAKLTEGFSETAGFDPITIKDQAQRATGLIKSSIDDARAVIRGEAPLPEGLRGTSLITAMEEHLLQKPDAKLAHELANSPLTSATSVAAQEMRLMAERVPDSITAKFQEIREARQAGSKLRGETPERVFQEIKTEVVRQAAKRQTWEDFVRQIACA